MSRRSALAALRSGALLFGLTGVSGELASVPPGAIMFDRALFAMFTLGLFARLAGQAWYAPRSTQWLHLALCGLLLAEYWVSFFIVVKTTGVAITALGFINFPAFTVTLEGLLFRERTRLTEGLPAALVSLGLMLVTPNFDLTSGATLDLLWAIPFGLLFALLLLANRSDSGQIDPAQAALWQNLVVALYLPPFVAGELPALPALDWLWLALLGMFCTGLTHSLFVTGLTVIKARTVALVFTLEPVYGIAFAWLLSHETPGPRTSPGGVLIVLAIVLPTRLSARGRPVPGSGLSANRGWTHRALHPGHVHRIAEGTSRPGMAAAGLRFIARGRTRAPT